MLKQENKCFNKKGNMLYKPVLEIIYDIYQEIYNTKMSISDKEGKQIKEIITKATSINKENPLTEIEQKCKYLKELVLSQKNDYWKFTPGILLSRWNEIICKEITNESDYSKYCGSNK